MTKLMMSRPAAHLKIPAKKSRRRPVKEEKAKLETKRLWNGEEALLLVKVNESRYFALFVVSGSMKKFFSVDCVNIYFSQSIVNYPFLIFFQ